jgi:hypothetical protein
MDENTVLVSLGLGLFVLIGWILYIAAKVIK